LTKDFLADIMLEQNKEGRFRLPHLPLKSEEVNMESIHW
jgi:hypothetical protein